MKRYRAINVFSLVLVIHIFYALSQYSFSAIDIFMGIPGVKLSVTVFNDFKNKETWGTIFTNGFEIFIRKITFSGNENDRMKFF